MKTTALILLLLCIQCCSAPAQDVLAMKKQLPYTKDDTARARLLNDIGSAFYFNYEYDSCKKYGTLALQLAGKLLNTATAKENTAYTLQCQMLKAKALENLGSSFMYENVNTAGDTLLAASALWNETGNKKGIASAYQRLGELYMNQNNFANALKYFNASLNLYIETGDKQNTGLIYFETALVERYMGNYGDALGSNINALTIAKETNDTLMMLQCLLANGFINMMVKNYNEALKIQQAALNISIAKKDSEFIATAYSDMGVTNMRAGNLDAALKDHETALTIRKRLNFTISISSSYSYISEILAQQGKYRQALAYDLEGLKYAKRQGDTRFILDTYNDIADNYLSIHDYENALKNYDTLLQQSIRINDSHRKPVALKGIADIFLKQGKTTEAITWLQKAVIITDANDYRNLRTIYKSLSAAYAKTGDYKNAYESSIKFKQFSDSAASKEKAEKLASLTNQLEFENKQTLLKASQDKQLAVKQSEIERQKLVRNITAVGLLVVVALAIMFFMRFREKRQLNIALEETLTNLKSTQSQLVQSEKMASLGELTAGVAHEIQNPLNFINNFSEVNTELIEELKSERLKAESQRQKEVEDDIINDISQNLERISFHGKRADAIVKGMLQHSRKNTGQKEPTNINKLADEYLRLSFHGIRAKDKSFNSVPMEMGIKTEFDESIAKINIVPQDIGRVLLNLFNNAFYAVNEKSKDLSGLNADAYKPLVSVQTKKINDKIEIRVKDNGNGIPQNIIDKIFQPFFTTKPTGEGTGLGLSLSYDIIKAHGGTIKVESKEGEARPDGSVGQGSVFIIQIPILV